MTKTNDAMTYHLLVHLTCQRVFLRQLLRQADVVVAPVTAGATWRRWLKARRSRRAGGFRRVAPRRERRVRNRHVALRCVVVVAAVAVVDDYDAVVVGGRRQGRERRDVTVTPSGARGGRTLKRRGSYTF